MKVFYIELHEKSLAKDLHKDAIAFEVEESQTDKPKRVEFLHFEGVAPRQFNHMFRAVNRKDGAGKFIAIKPNQAEKVLPEYLDNYQDFEAKAVENLVAEIERLTSSTPLRLRQFDRQLNSHNNGREPHTGRKNHARQARRLTIAIGFRCKS
jgi:hypothetical protein